MRDERLADRAAARKDRNQPFRHAGFREQLADAQARERREVGGLAHDALPVARAGARNSAMIISGKFHGVIDAQTPTGWR